MADRSTSRRELLTVASSLAVASTAVAGTASPVDAEQTVGGVNAIPELAPQWQKLDLAEILSRPSIVATENVRAEVKTEQQIPVVTLDTTTRQWRTAHVHRAAVLRPYPSG